MTVRAPDPTIAHASDVSVIVVNWNTRDALRRCLDSVAATASELQIETIVIDNGSWDGSQEMVRAAYPTVTLVENSDNVGFARANNQGATYAHAPLLLLLNSDAAVLPGALDAATTYMRAHKDAGAVGLRLLNDDLTPQPSGKRFPTLASTIVGLSPLPERWRAACDRRRNARDYTRIADVDEVSAAAVMVRRDLFNALGGFDRCFYFFGEDVDLCWRIKEQGYRIAYLPAARAIHSWGGARRHAPSIRYGLLSQRAQYQLFRRQRPRSQAEFLRLYLLAFTVVRAVRAAAHAVVSATPARHVAAHLYARECLWLSRPDPCVDNKP